MEQLKVVSIYDRIVVVHRLNPDEENLKCFI